MLLVWCWQHLITPCCCAVAKPTAPLRRRVQRLMSPKRTIQEGQTQRRARWVLVYASFSHVKRFEEGHVSLCLFHEGI